MKACPVALVLVFSIGLSVLAQAPGQAGGSLESEMAKLGVQTAVLVPSQGVDEFPVWSPNGRFLAVNLEGKWFKLDTSNVQLQEATWHGQRVGAVRDKPELTAMSKGEAGDWTKQVRHGASKVTGKSGLRAEIERHELSASLVLSRGTRRMVIWKTDMENCGELSLSPNGAYLAYICEMNGVLVMDLEQAFQNPPKP